MKRLSSLALSLILTACGTRDYAPTPPPNSPAAPEATPEGRAPRIPQGQVPRPQADTKDVGYLWRGMNWIGVSDSTVDGFKANLADGPGTNGFQALGAAMTGGAVLGLVIRASGTWFLGRPIEPVSGNWFWQQAERAARGGARGVVRGALLTGACYALLEGIDPLPFDGVLGPDFKALSAATALSAMAAISAAPYMQKLAQPGWGDPEKPIGHYLGRYPRVKAAADRIHDWTDKSPLGQGVRYKVIPGVLIVGVAAGVGLLVYESLDGDGD